ncbi:hypothetical protein [Streptomyces corynorhini]|uniref:Uncharacterized protein n=1 Tax=Streptomyces corynorhini TaxID=2282652 RepID=A0A370B9L4_9ACTN|nr:hypothetical protein [Streptomyces corynorhini]RDG38480.1 hypothetical protein DVH02_08980 [Streptomyces corynorhini]
MAIIPLDLLDRIRALERQVRDLMGSARARPAATVRTAAADTLSAQAVPYPRPWPVAAARWESTGSAGWTTLYRSTGIVRHPRLYCRIDAEGGPSAGLRLLVDGVPTGPEGGAGGLDFTEPVNAASGTVVTFEVQARVTTAGETVRCLPVALYGVRA